MSASRKTLDPIWFCPKCFNIFEKRLPMCCDKCGQGSYPYKEIKTIGELNKIVNEMVGLARQDVDKKIKTALDKKEVELTKRWGKIQSEAFNTKNYWMEQVYKWAVTPIEKRKPANINFTASTERNICYHIEHLEYELKKARQDAIKEVFKKFEDYALRYQTNNSTERMIYEHEYQKLKKELEK